MKFPSRFAAKFLIYFTIFLDQFGLLIVLPIFSTYLLYPEFGVFSSSVSLEEKFILLGFLLGSYPLAQFYGGPIIEQFSLRAGSKNALVLSIILKTLGAFLTAYALLHIDLFLLFLGRMLNGFSATSQHLVLKTLGKKELSQKKISLHTAFEGLGFISAIFLGGYFSDPTISLQYSPDLPLWILGGIYILQLGVYLFLFPDKKAEGKNVQIRWMQCTKNIKKAFHSKQIRAICLIYFLVIFAWMTTLQFNSVYLIEKFHSSQWTITSVYLVMAIIWSIARWIFDANFARYICSKTTLAKSLGLMTFSSGLALFAPSLLSYYIAVSLMAIFVAVAWSAALITKFIRIEVQPSQNKSSSLSMKALALSLGPIVIGFFLYINIGFLHLLGALSSLMALRIHQKYYKCFQDE